MAGRSGERGGIDRAGAKQPQSLAVGRDDGRFQAERGGAGVEDQADLSAERAGDMRGRRRADPATAVGRRGGCPERLENVG